MLPNPGSFSAVRHPAPVFLNDLDVEWLLALLMVSTSRHLSPEVSAKWSGWHHATDGLAGTPGQLTLVPSSAAQHCPPTLLRTFHVQPWDWEGPVAPSKMFRKFVLSQFLMGRGGCVLATGCRKMWRWLPESQVFAHWPVRYKQALSPHGGKSQKRWEIR